MYAVSEAYKTQMKKAVQTRKLRGLINDVLPFTDDDILQGSFRITNQIMDTSSFGYGGVYVGELHLTFVTQRVYDRKNWRGKRLYIEDGLYIDSEDDYEYVPLGHFKVVEANYTIWGLEIKAYDLMTKFDKPFGGIQNAGTPYELASLACIAAGVPMKQTQEEFEAVAALPSGTLVVSNEGIETWRDYLSYLCQACNMYCTMARDGSLDFRKIMPAQDSLVDTPTDTIGLNNRFDDGSFSDFITEYTGITATFTHGREEVTMMYGTDEGVVIDFGANPLLQEAVDDEGAEALATITQQVSDTADAISDIESQISTLEDQIADVEEQIEEHPEDKVLKKLLERLKNELKDAKKAKETLSDYYTELVETKDRIEQQVEAQAIDSIGIRLNYLAVDLQSIQYSPATVSMLGDPAYDLGDVLRFEAGIAGGMSDVCIMRYDYAFNSRYSVETFGDNPVNNGAKSKDAKSAATKDKGADTANIINFAEYINAGPYDLQAITEDQRIALVHFAVSEDSAVEEWIEIKLEAQGGAHVKLHYYFDGEELEEYEVEETFSAAAVSAYFNDDELVINTSSGGEDGTFHTVNYHWHLPQVSKGSYHTWEVRMDVLEGDVSISTGDIHCVLWAQSMLAEGQFLGLIEASDEVPFLKFTNPKLFGVFSEAVSVKASSHEDNRITEDGDSRVTEDGNQRITE